MDIGGRCPPASFPGPHPRQSHMCGKSALTSSQAMRISGVTWSSTTGQMRLVSRRYGPVQKVAPFSSASLTCKEAEGGWVGGCGAGGFGWPRRLGGGHAR